MCRHPSHQQLTNTINIINIYSQFQETLSVEIQQLDWMRRVMQKFIVLSVLISACLSRAFRHSYFRSCKCKTRDIVPRTTLLCLYTSCLIITDNWWMRKFAGYSVCKVSLVYVLPSSTPPLVTRFHWLCSDFVPFLMTKCLVCFAELNLHCFSSKKSLKRRKDSSKRSSGMPLAWL